MPHSHGGNKCSARGGGSVSHCLAPQQGRSDPANPVQLAQIAWSALVPAVLLTALGWWGTAGFTRRSTWRSLVPFLPLILLFAVPPVLSLVFGPRVASHAIALSLGTPRREHMPRSSVLLRYARRTGDSARERPRVLLVM